MYAEINKIYNFTFTSRFTSFNGIYQVINILQYAYLLNNKIDLFEVLFKPCGITRETYDGEIDDYREDNFYHLRNANTGDEIYVPESFLSVYPNPNVEQYSKVGIVLNLGEVADDEIINSIISILNDEVIGRTGISTTPKVVTYGKVYMTKEGYATIEATREAAKTEVTNTYAELQACQALLTKANTRNAKLEAIVIAQQ